MCDKYQIFTRGDIYEARNKVTRRRYARYKATPRRWRELRRDGTACVDNLQLIDTLEAAVCEHVTPTRFDAPCSERPQAVPLRHLNTYPRNRRRDWRGEAKS